MVLYDTTVISDQVTFNDTEVFKYACFSVSGAISNNVWNVVNDKTLCSRLTINIWIGLFNG